MRPDRFDDAATAKQIDAACSDFEKAWRDGRRQTIEELVHANGNVSRKSLEPRSGKGVGSQKPARPRRPSPTVMPSVSLLKPVSGSQTPWLAIRKEKRGSF